MAKDPARTRMPLLPGALCLALLAAGPALAADEAPPAAPREPEATSIALYPLWESTGRVLGHGRLHLGTASADVGLLDVFQVGVRPTPFLFRTPNLHVKLRLLERAGLVVAAHAELLVFLPGASEAFTSTNYVSRVDTRDAALPVLPLGISATWRPRRWLALHGTASALATFASGPYVGGVTPGATAVAEALVHPNHALSLHVGEVGFWAHDFALVGASYRFRHAWLEAQLGYFYRFTRDGAQGSPLISLGAYL